MNDRPPSLPESAVDAKSPERSVVDVEASKKPADSLRFIALVTRLLLITALGLGGYIVVSLTIKSPSAAKAGVRLQGGDLVGLDNKAQIPQPPPFDEYANVITKRDLFELPVEESSPAIEPQAVQPAPVQVVQRDLSQELRLVGIVLDDQPQAVIEDIRNKETIFLRKGEQHGDIILEDVQAGKVTIRYHQELVELTP